MPGLTSRMRSSKQRDREGEVLQQLGPLGARADQAHLAAQHVPELRQLVEPRLAQEPADPRDARVVLRRRAPRRCRFSASGVIVRNLCIVELGERERGAPLSRGRAAELPGALLAEQDRPGRIEVDGRGDDRHQRAPSERARRPLRRRRSPAWRSERCATRGQGTTPSCILDSWLAPIRLTVPGTLRFRAIAVRVVAEAARLVSCSAQRDADDPLSNGRPRSVRHRGRVGVHGDLQQHRDPRVPTQGRRRDRHRDHAERARARDRGPRSRPRRSTSPTVAPLRPSGRDTLPEGGMGIHIARPCSTK